ncbi:2136_t:CDS:2, partial [Racocetra persica]
MSYPQTSNQNQNKSMFHATFLDGFRGLAALSVLWAHSQAMYPRLDFNTFDYMGFYGVIMFFVLSAFLLTFRSLLEWEKYHEKREEEQKTDSIVVNNDHLESCVDLETNLSNIPLLSSTNSDNIFARFGAFLTNHYFKKPAIGAWICRIIANVIIVTIRTKLLIASSERDDGFYSNSFVSKIHIFLTGSICAIWYREIIRLGLLPLRLEEEKNILAENLNNFNIPTLIKPSFVQLIISKLPSRHQFARWFFDLGCYFFAFIKLCTLPHPAEIVFGLPRSYDMFLERKKLGGLLDAILILFGLLSRNGSFAKALSCDFLRLCGQISFSIYLLHPLGMKLVNECVPSIGYHAANQESDAIDKGNAILDA